jgi:hypothetical protein
MDLRGRAPELVDFVSEHALQGCDYGEWNRFGFIPMAQCQMEALH